jgi:hypothetical protein
MNEDVLRRVLDVDAAMKILWDDFSRSLKYRNYRELIDFSFIFALFLLLEAYISFHFLCTFVVGARYFIIIISYSLFTGFSWYFSS